MAVASASDFVTLLRRHQLLQPQQLADLAALQAKHPDPKKLAGELLRRGWLTPYQVNQLFQGRGGDLMLGQYILLERLGEGGMGQVFKARHRQLDRVDALKVIRKEHLAKANAVERFRREAKAAARLTHPNVVHIYDAGEVGGTHFLAMEYVEGRDLAQVVKEKGPLPVAQACDYIRQAALGLQHAHESGLVHRDIKPANLMVAGGGWRVASEGRGDTAGDSSSALATRHAPPATIKILDMGLARLQQADDEKSSTISQEGSVVGTLDFLAPEQAADSRKVDIRADLYGLGCSFYYLLTGRTPFRGETTVEKLYKHQFETATPVEQLRKDVPPEVAAVVRKLMAKKPEDRYQTPAELAEALLPFCSLDPMTQTSSRTKVLPASAAKKPSFLKKAAIGIGLSLGRVLAAGSKKAVVWIGRSPRRMAAAGGVALSLVVLLGLVLRFSGSTTEAPPTPDDPLVATPAQPNPSQPAGPQLEKEITNSIKMKLVLIPAGSFQMGAIILDEPANQDENPKHPVTITKPFYMGIYEVTQRQYADVTGLTPSECPDEDHPVENVSWHEAAAFCQKLSERPEEKKAGRVYRLPTEAEWEYACRAGSEKAYYFGSKEDVEKLSEYAWFKKNAEDKTHPAGKLKPNAWGLYDMHGNVWEWCKDAYDEQFYKHKDSLLADPQGPPPQYWQPDPNPDPKDRHRGRGGRMVERNRVFRGGAYDASSDDCRSARRKNARPDSERLPIIGFRVVCQIAVPEKPPEKPPEKEPGRRGHRNGR